MFAENLPPSLHRLILLKEQHGCSARKLRIKGYFWTCECHQLYLPVASCFTWLLVEKDIRGGEGGHQICIYTMGYGQIHRVVTKKKESGEFALHCFCFRQMPSTKLGGTNMPCYSIAIRADYTLTLPKIVINLKSQQSVWIRAPQPPIKQEYNSVQE